MIKNPSAVLAATLATLFPLSACGERESAEEGFQGVVEFDERDLGFELGGRLREVFVSEGDEVKAGQLLARLDDTLDRGTRDVREREAAAARAQADLARTGARSSDVAALAARVDAAAVNERLLRSKLDREQTLLAGGASTQAVVEELQARTQGAAAERRALENQLRSLRAGARDPEITGADERAGAAAAAADVARERLRRYDLVAAAPGTVLDVHADPGEVVAAGAPVVTLADLAEPYADVFVPQPELGGVRVGASARIKVDAIDQPLAGKVEHIGSRAEFTPRFIFSERERPNLVVRVRVRIRGGGRVAAGTPAFVEIEGMQ